MAQKHPPQGWSRDVTASAQKQAHSELLFSTNKTKLALALQLLPFVTPVSEYDRGSLILELCDVTSKNSSSSSLLVFRLAQLWITERLTAVDYVLPAETPNTSPLISESGSPTGKQWLPASIAFPRCCNTLSQHLSVLRGTERLAYPLIMVCQRKQRRLGELVPESLMFK